jgi:hypothetical protein
MRKLCVLLLVASWTLAACGGDDGGDGGALAAADPRCQDLCTEAPPLELEGAGSTCSPESTQLCAELCQQRIEGASNLCASCLLEEANLYRPDTCDYDSRPLYTPDGTILGYTLSSRGIECYYDVGDVGAEDDCIRSLCPVVEVECQTSFGEVASCSDICTQSLGE